MTDAPRSTPRSPYHALRRALQVLWLQVPWLVLAAALVVATAAQAETRILAMGDSLTAGAGVKAADSLPAQLKRRLIADGYDIEMIQAGVSGDTTTGGLARLDYTLDSGPVNLVILELGANDMLNGYDPAVTRANLDQVIATLKARGAVVLLAAMVSSENYGQAYKKAFDSIYPDLARKYGLTMIPFLLDGVWGHPELLVDGVHPNAEGIAKIVRKISPIVEKTLSSMGAKRLTRVQ